MQKVAIVTDSSACLSGTLAASAGVEVVPVEMILEGRVYRDGLDDAGDFYRLLREARTLPKTSAPSPGQFLQAFRRARERAPSILCITLPANLSSLHNASQQAVALAAEQMPGLRIRTIEAGAVAAGQGLIVLEAARAAMDGQELDQVESLVADLGPRVHFFAALDTLEFLARGGHVPKVAAWLGNVMGIRPILTAPGGDVRRITQARSRRAALARILNLMEERNPKGAPIRVLVMHADALSEAQALAEQVRQRFPCEELHVTQFTPVMGAHSGPGVLGVAFRVV